LAGLVDGPVAEHGVEDVDASAGQADQGGVVLLAGGAFAVAVGPARLLGSCRAANAARKKGSLELLVPARLGCSPRTETPDLRVTGAKPA